MLFAVIELYQHIPVFPTNAFAITSDSLTLRFSKVFGSVSITKVDVVHVRIKTTPGLTT